MRKTRAARHLVVEIAGKMGDWADQAVCSQVDPDLFFPAKEGAPAKVELAKEVCGRCPVQADCLAWAVSFPERFGVWGATSAPQRTKMRRQARLAARHAANA
jgi:WhiB family transcriptional regulator, redox-sensing transcriptional regulator